MWLTSTVRRRENPDWCQDGGPPLGPLLPGRPQRAADLGLRPATEEWGLVDTCYGTHHLLFGEDEQDQIPF